VSHEDPDHLPLLAVALATFWLVAAFISFRSNVHDGYDDVPHTGSMRKESSKRSSQGGLDEA
jgi:hypothetical protein